MPVNFQKLRGYIEPVVKLGHDKSQTLARLRESSGWLNLGDFAAVTPKAGGRFSVTLVNVPVEIGRLVNAGRIRSGSVELIPYCDDPRDQGKRVEGPIITGVALLGEEHPAVKGFAPPRAVFPDGRPVPPATDLTPWFEAMAQAAQMSARTFSEPAPPTYRTRDGHEYPLTVTCFSEFAPMLDQGFLKSLGLSDEQIQAIMAKEGGAPDQDQDADDAAPPLGGGAPPAPEPPPGDKMAGAMPGPSAAMPGPAATPVPDKLSQDDQTMMSAAAFSEMQKRLGALEKKYSDATSEANKATMSAYSERVANVIKANGKRIAPNLRAAFKQMGLDALTKRNFADVTGDGEKAFAAWVATVESLPESANFSEQVDDTAPQKKGRELTPLQRRILDSRSTKQQAPVLRQQILESTKPSAN